MTATGIPDEDFGPILDQVKDFVRQRVLPRENEIMQSDEVPADIRESAAAMGLFGYAIPADRPSARLPALSQVSRQ